MCTYIVTSKWNCVDECQIRAEVSNLTFLSVFDSSNPSCALHLESLTSATGAAPVAVVASGPRDFYFFLTIPVWSFTIDVRELDTAYFVPTLDWSKT